MNYEKTIKSNVVYNGTIINVEKIDVLLPNGKLATRDIVRHIGASVIIPIDSDNNIYMVEQFRKPVDCLQLELPAGKLDFKGEDPKECAIRELKEETGLSASKVEYITSIYTSPGVIDEILHIYLAEELTEGETKLDEEEFITIKKFPINKLINMIFTGEIKDAKTIIGLLMTERIINQKL